MRRLALAEELIGDPAFLLLDELTSGLDVYSDREMMLWLRDLAHVHGKTVILVTHATYHLEYCDAILFLHQGGRQVQFGALSGLAKLSREVNSITDLFELYQTQEHRGFHRVEFLSRLPRVSAQKLKTGRPPSRINSISHVDIAASSALLA